MQLSIRQASRFVIGAAMMRAKAIEASGNNGITFDSVALASMRANADGAKLRQSIETLADQEATWLRNNPPHTLATDRVMQSRQAELKTFRSINAAVIVTSELANKAMTGDEDAGNVLHEQLVSTLGVIDQTPGSTQDRRNLLTSLKAQVALAGPADFMSNVMRSAEGDYAERFRAERLARYMAPPLERGEDFDDTPGM
jgi:hypothetical protein